MPPELALLELSPAERFTRLAEAERRAFLESLSVHEATLLLYEWKHWWARPKQLPPADKDWTIWLILAGRGFGKTKAIVEWAMEQARLMPGSRGALVGATAGDVRDILIEGESGILASSPPHFMPHYEPSKRRLTWANGSIATTYSADEPERLRGKQHHWAIVDELAAWRYPEAFDQLQLGLRLRYKGSRPRVVIATTPRPTPIIRDLLKDPTCRVTRGTTYENRANLAEDWFAKILRKYEGSRLGRQELLAELLEDVPGALWTRTLIDAHRLHEVKEDLKRIVIGIDPATTSNEDSAETGIVVMGLGAKTEHGYVLGDFSVRDTPAEWANRALNAYEQFNADAFIVEVNQGGDMVAHTLKIAAKERGINPNSLKIINARAGESKGVRAEPVSTLYETGMIHHVGMFGTLEDQMCTWTPAEKSPDRMDALVWAAHSLLVKPVKRSAAQGKVTGLWG